MTGPDVPSMRFKKAEDKRKLASALIVFSAFRVSNPPTRPGETAQNLMSSARPVDTICRVVAGRSQTSGDTGEGDEGDVEFRNARMYTRAFLTKCDNSWGGIMQVVPEAGCSV